MTNFPQTVSPVSFWKRSKTAWGGPTLKGPLGLDLESIFDKNTRDKSISFSVVTNVGIVQT